MRLDIAAYLFTGRESIAASANSGFRARRGILTPPFQSPPMPLDSFAETLIRSIVPCDRDFVILAIIWRNREWKKHLKPITGLVMRAGNPSVARPMTAYYVSKCDEKLWLGANVLRPMRSTIEKLGGLIVAFYNELMLGPTI